MLNYEVIKNSNYFSVIFSLFLFLSLFLPDAANVR